MKDQIKTQEMSVTAALTSSSNSVNTSVVSSYENRSSQMTYNEMSDFPVQQMDPIEQLQKNLAHLAELQSKMGFMMREVRYLLKV